MSKIAIKGNESGTATFTIEAPATNTDRIFELPDEAGKVLTTGNNDPAEVFKQANILGTVSESGGVPTGAIIERDSNANGEFVKYADGTMICTIDLFPSVEKLGDDAGDWTFPASFIAPPVVTGVAATRSLSAGSGLNGVQTGTGGSWGSNNTNVNITHGSTTSTAFRSSLLAIGRWY